MCDVRWIKTFYNSDFLRQNAILLIGATVAGVINYLFYPVIGRLLDPAAFGEVQVLFSLFLQLTIFLAVLGVVVVFVVANYKSITQRNATILELEKASLWVASVIFLAMVMGSEWLRVVFKFESAAPFWWLGILLVVSVPFAFRTAFLRGRHNFLASSLANFLAALGKFVFAVPLVLFGFGASGALAGVAVGQSAALAFAAWRAGEAGLTRPKGFGLLRRLNLSKILPELKYSLLVLIGSLAIMLQITIDTLVVKYWFDPHTAGLYAGVVTVARTIFFLTAPVVMALLPSVSLGVATRVNQSQLFKSLGLFAVIGLPLLVVMAIFPKQVVTLLMGQGYAEVAGLLPLLALTTLFISLTNVVVSYFLALKRYISALIGIIGFAATFGLMCFHHGSLQAVVESLFVGSMVSMCLIAIWATSERLTSRGSIDETTATIHSGSGSQRIPKHPANLPSPDRDHK